MSKPPVKKKPAAVPQKSKPGMKGQDPGKISLQKALMPLLFILPLVFAAFSPILNNQLTNWDDPDLIIDNPLIRELSLENLRKIFTEYYFGNYQPLHLVSYSIEYHFWQLNPAGYHTVSLSLMLLTTALVYYFLYRISRRNLTVAVIGTLLFALNAMRVESVAWAAERKDMLYSLFYVATLIGYVAYMEGHNRPGQGYRTRFLVVSFLFFILAVFSKVMAVSVVGAMVFLDYLYERRLTLRLVVEKLPWVALSIIVGLIQVDATASAGTIDQSGMFTFTDRLLIAARNLVFFLYKTLIPLNLSAFHPYPLRAPGDPWPAEFYAAPVILALILAGLIITWRKSRIPVFAAGFYLSGVALVLQFVAIGPSMFNERYSLIPSIALSFGLASGIAYLVKKFPGWKHALFGATGLYLAVMFYLTFLRCDIWKDSMTLWNDVLDQYPYASMALNNRGKVLGKDLGNTTLAMKDLTAAIRYDPRFEQPYSNRGIIYAMNGKFDSALSDFNQAIRLKSTYFEALSNRAIVYMQTRRPDSAIRDFTRCLELEPGRADLYVSRGYSYMMKGETDKALEDMNRGIAMNPGNPEFYLRRSEVHFNRKNYSAAWQDVEVASRAGVNVNPAYRERVRVAAGM